MFTEHGCFHVELRGNILYLDIEGAWNIETSIAYRKAITESIQPLIGKPWAAMTLMNDWELCTPDSEIVIFDITKEALANGLVREAVVNSTGLIKLELFEKYKNIEVPTGVNMPFKRRIYQDEQSALDWLAEEGFSNQTLNAQIGLR